MNQENAIELTNAISGLILADHKDIRTIRARVNHFNKLLDDTLRNFYEIKMQQDVPLFTLCEYLELGKDNYGFTEEEYNEEIRKLLHLVSRRFGESLKLEINWKMI